MDSLRVRVKTNMKKDEILSRGDCWVVAVAAPAIDNKANVRLVKFLSKELGRQLRIKSGLRSKEKVLI